MVDATGDLLDGMHAMRVRQALLVTALLKLGEPLAMTRAAATQSAGHDVAIRHTDDGIEAYLKDAPR